MANQHKAHDPLHLIRQLLKVSQEAGRLAGSLGLQVLEHLKSSVHLAGTQAEQAPANLQHTSAVAAQLLSIAALLGVKDAKGGTPLLYAAQNGHSALVNALVVSGACPLTQRFDGSGNSALHVAAAQGHLPVVRFLLPAMQAAAAGTSTGDPDSKQGTDFAAHTAGSQCSTCSSPPSKLPSSVSGSQQQENAHAPVSMGEPWVTLPVQPTASSSTTTAAAAAGPDSASLSPVAPAPADLANSNGDTALMFALSGGHMGIAAALLQAGASVLLANSDGLTSLMLAAGGSHEHCVQLVLRAASKATRAEASTQVSMASAPASPAQDGLVGLLVAVDVFGNNALHYAARAGASSCVALILAAAHSAGVKHTEATESSVSSVGTSSSGSTAQGACRSQQPPGEHATSAQASSSSSSSSLGCDALHALLLGRNTEGRTALTESRKARHKGCEEMLHQAWEQLSPQPPPTQDPSSTSTQQMPSAAKQPQATSKQTGTASPAEALPAELHSVASSSSFAAGAAAITAAAATADVGVAIAEAAEPQVEASNTSRVVPHAPRQHSKSGTDNEGRGGAWTIASSTGPQRRHAQQAAGPPAHAQHVVSVGANPRPGPAPGPAPGPGPGHADVSVGAGRSRNTLAETVGAAGGATRPKATAAPSVPQRQQHSRHEMADDAAQASLGRSLNAPVSAPACAEQLARIAATPVGGMKAQGWAGIVRGPASDGAGCQSPSLSKPFSSEGWKRAISREMMASAGRLTGQAKLAPGQSVPDATAGGGTSHMAAGASAASAGAELNAAAATPANSAAISSTVKHDTSNVIQHGDELKEEGQIASSSEAAAADSAECSTDEGHDPAGWLAEARIAMAKLLPDSAELDLSPWHMAGLGLSSLSGGQLDALAALHLKALLQVQSLVLEQAAGVQAQVAQEAQTRAQDIQRLLGKPGSSSPAV